MKKLVKEVVNNYDICYWKQNRHYKLYRLLKLLPIL